MAEEQNPESPLSSAKHKFGSSLRFSSCFHPPRRRRHHHHDEYVQPTLVRSSSLHSKSRSNDLSHLKETCGNFISRIGRHNRRDSADFHYDAVSYSLNFEDEANEDRHMDDIRSFWSRLPPSPLPPPSTRTSSASTTAHEIPTQLI